MATQNSLLGQLPKDLQTVKLSQIKQHIVVVALNRPKKLNAFNPQLFIDLKVVFEALDKVDDLRCVILTAEGKNFTAGLDLMENADFFTQEIEDQARSSLQFLKKITEWQDVNNAIQNLHVPVISGVHGYCMGAGVDMICACDIRFCSENAKFSIKEIDIANAADLGTLQRMPLIVGNNSKVREYAYTGRIFDAQEALQIGLVSKIEKEENLMNSMIKLAEEISAKSPVGISAIKKVLNSQNKNKISKGLEYVALLNMSQLYTKDIKEAVAANLGKRQAKFSKL